MVATAPHGNAVAKLGFAAGPGVLGLGYDPPGDDELPGSVGQTIEGAAGDENF